MRLLTPPVHLLKALITTARFGSISRAAEALHLTQSAVGKQVQELERATGLALFERVRKRLTLTPAGQRFEAAVRSLLSQLKAATLALITDTDSGGALHFVPCVRGYNFQRPDLNCSILFGDGHWPGAVAHYLVSRETLLIAPPLSAQRPRLRSPADVAKYTLLKHVSVSQAWSNRMDTHRI